MSVMLNMSLRDVKLVAALLHKAATSIRVNVPMDNQPMMQLASDLHQNAELLLEATHYEPATR